MSGKNKYILVYGDVGYNRVFAHLVNNKDRYLVINPISQILPGYVKWDKNVELVVFTGGPDIDPAMYGARPHKKAQRPDLKRDKTERRVYNLCRAHNIPMVGICRGAQLLNVMNGGKLIQHVENHIGMHDMILSGSYVVEGVPHTIPVTSTHHQMMVVGKGADIIGYSVNVAFNGKQIEPEVVYYPKSKSMCIQYHPERMNTDTPARILFDTIIKEEFLDA